MSAVGISKELFGAVSISLIFHFGLLFGMIPDLSSPAGQQGQEKLIVSFGAIELPVPNAFGITQELISELPPMEKPLPPPERDSITTESLPERADKKPQPELIPDNQHPGTPELTAGQIEDIKTSFLREVVAKIQRVKRYPESAKRNNWEGTAKVEFIISGDGKVNSVSIITSSGYTLLDEEAKAMVKRAEPFRPIPKELNMPEMRLLLPILFRLEKQE